MSMTIEGGCLCGAVRYRVQETPAVVGDCYCVDCRRSSGTSHCTHVMVSDAAFSSTGEVSFYERPADSGNVVRRGFCPTCGSALYSTNGAMPGAVFLRASSMDDLDLVTPMMTVYAARAPKWAHIDRSNPVFEGMASEVAAEAADRIQKQA